MPTVDGVTTATDAHGVIQGNGGSVDKLAGGSGNDKLEGQAAFNQYYGGAGSDTFIIAAKFSTTSATASADFSAQAAYITDFTGGGGHSGGDNDFIAFTGFGAGSWLTLTHTGTSGTSGATIYYYAIHDGVTGDIVNIEINSLSGAALGAGDYAFYA